MRGPHHGVYLGGFAYRLGELHPITLPTGVTEPEDASRLLQERGVETFSWFRDELPSDVILDCLRETLLGVDPAAVDTVLVVTESYADLFAAPLVDGETDFRARRNRLFDILNAAGLTGAPIFSITYGGSGNFFQGLYLARSLIDSGAAARILMLCADRHPAHVSRFMAAAIAMTGDGVASCLVSAAPMGEADEGAGPHYEIEHMGIKRFQPVDPPDAMGRLILEMYRSTKDVAADCYDELGLQPSDYDWLLLSNYNDTTTKVFGTLLGFSQEAVFGANAGRTGHVPACDPLINLSDLASQQRPADGSHLLLFANGPQSCGVVSLAYHSGRPKPAGGVVLR